MNNRPEVLQFLARLKFLCHGIEQHTNYLCTAVVVEDERLGVVDRRQVRMVQIDAGVDHRDANAGAVSAQRLGEAIGRGRDAPQPGRGHLRARW